MAQVEVKLTIEIDDTVGTDDELEAYIEYELGYSCELSLENPYNKEGMEIIDMEIE